MISLFSICGNISKFGTQTCEAFGGAAMPTGQPGHCVFVWNDKIASMSKNPNTTKEQWQSLNKSILLYIKN